MVTIDFVEKKLQQDPDWTPDNEQYTEEEYEEAWALYDEVMERKENPMGSKEKVGAKKKQLDDYADDDLDVDDDGLESFGDLGTIEDFSDEDNF